VGRIASGNDGAPRVASVRTGVPADAAGACIGTGGGPAPGRDGANAGADAVGAAGRDGANAGADGGSPGLDGANAGAEGANAAGRDGVNAGADGGSAPGRDGANAGAEGGSPGRDGANAGAEGAKAAGRDGVNAGAEGGSVPGFDDAKPGAEERCTETAGTVPVPGVRGAGCEAGGEDDNSRARDEVSKSSQDDVRGWRLRVARSSNTRCDGVGERSAGNSRSRSNSPSKALNTLAQRPQRTQPSETLSWSCTTRNTVWQTGQRVARLMRR
jgi:hypothetical protein